MRPANDGQWHMMEASKEYDKLLDEKQSLEKAVKQYREAIDKMYNESSVARALVVRHLGTIHPFVPL